MDEAMPYIHWTFPDSKFEDNPDPSYMMARRLNRKKASQSKVKPIECSFATQVQFQYDSSSIPTSIVQAPTITMPPAKSHHKAKKRKRHPDQPLAPKRPKTAFFCFLSGERKRLKDKHVKIAMTELTKAASQHWKFLPEETKAPFLKEADKLKTHYAEDMNKYQNEMEAFRTKYPDWVQADEDNKATLKKAKTSDFVNLFNKVVKLTKEGQRQAGDEFHYYYVLTYIPDLYWCHLAPMRKAGIFGSNKKSAGKTKWMLVDEGEGKELDITGAICQVVKSRCTRGCADADKEEWDIIDLKADVATVHYSQHLQAHEVSREKLTSLESDIVGNTALTDNGNFPIVNLTTNSVPLHQVSSRGNKPASFSGSDASMLHGQTTMDTTKHQLLQGNSEQTPESDLNSYGDSNEGANDNLSEESGANPLVPTFMDKVITPIIQRNKKNKESSSSYNTTSSIQMSLKAFFKCD